MLELEFTSSPDQEILGLYQTYKLRLVVGNTLKDDLIIRDHQLTGEMFALEMLPQGVLGQNINRDQFYLVNGKKYSGAKFFQVGDQITLGATVFTLKSYTPPHDTTSLATMKEALAKIQQNDAHLLPLLAALEKELVALEREITQQEDQSAQTPGKST
ncbi:MAG: hypothetical protein J6Y94_06035 [Bacteriovoracaceae bacterium]|nr:hypothetical protein [Bacteriovoracaceae bacterium]